MIVAGANRARKTILEKILGRRRPGHRAVTKGSSESVPFMLQSEAIPPSPRAARFVALKRRKSLRLFSPILLFRGLSEGGGVIEGQNRQKCNPATRTIVCNSFFNQEERLVPKTGKLLAGRWGF
jgi:hypothetical protein